MDTLLTVIYGAGLNELWDNVLSNWITPLYLAAVAIFAIVFLKDRAWMKLIGFVGIAAVVGVLVFAGGEIFGDKDKGLTGVAKKASDDINTIVSPLTLGSGSVSFTDTTSGFND